MPQLDPGAGYEDAGSFAEEFAGSTAGGKFLERVASQLEGNKDRLQQDDARFLDFTLLLVSEVIRRWRMAPSSRYPGSGIESQVCCMRSDSAPWDFDL